LAGTLRAKKHLTNLSRIFQFYGTQQSLNLGRHPTFEDLEANRGVLGQAEYIKLFKDFEIEVK